MYIGGVISDYTGNTQSWFNALGTRVKLYYAGSGCFNCIVDTLCPNTSPQLSFTVLSANWAKSGTTYVNLTRSLL